MIFLHICIQIIEISHKISWNIWRDQILNREFWVP